MGVIGELAGATGVRMSLALCTETFRGDGRSNNTSLSDTIRYLPDEYHLIANGPIMLLRTLHSFRTLHCLAWYVTSA